jgi:transcriptional regulator with XRE-family HTH domain
MGVNIGRKISKKRQEMGITQVELAKKAGIAQSTLSNIEMGKKRPQFDTMSAVCQVLGLSVLELLTFEEQQSTVRFFEEQAAIQHSGTTSIDDMSNRLQAFERYLFDLYIAQPGS